MSVYLLSPVANDLSQWHKEGDAASSQNAYEHV